MANPGEVNQMIGSAYHHVFIGALEANIRGFENKFSVYKEPEKTSFQGRNGNTFSFDFCGINRQGWSSTEVFGECKGYSKGTGLLADFRAFVAKAYVTSLDYKRHRGDFFWFVTNVPFACNEGSGLRSVEFLRRTLADKDNPQTQQVLGSGHIDDTFVHDLANRIGVFILTDSFLMTTDLSYEVLAGETLWSILKKLHGGTSPAGFGAVASQIAQRNGLESPDKLLSGSRIRLSWSGMRRSWAAEDGAVAKF